MEKVKVLQPTYVKEFICDGNICEDNCCASKWNIFVDQKSYKKLKKIRDKNIKEKIEKYVKRNKGDIRDEHNYAKIIANECECCTFLTEEKLCCLQIQYGLGYLPNVCKIYPRIIKAIDNKLQKSLTLSCPLVAKIVLLNEEKITFEEVEFDLENYKIISEQYYVENDKRKCFKNFSLINNFCIQLLQNREYEIEERLIILGLFIEKLDKFEQQKNIDDIPALIRQYTNLIISGQFKNAFVNVPSKVEIQLKLLKQIVDEKFTRGIIGERYQNSLLETLVGLDFIDDFSFENLIKKYEDIYEKYYLPYIKRKKYIFENYLINYIFQHLFPFGMKCSIWSNYVLLIINYSLIKMHLIGMLGFHKERFDDELAIRCIQSFVKNYEHNQMFEYFMKDIMEENEKNTMAYMTILIKN